MQLEEVVVAHEVAAVVAVVLEVVVAQEVAAVL
jgi:hypothetical protein